jgi:hypothetical protein
MDLFNLADSRAQCDHVRWFAARLIVWKTMVGIDASVKHADKSTRLVLSLLRTATDNLRRTRGQKRRAAERKIASPGSGVGTRRMGSMDASGTAHTTGRCSADLLSRNSTGILCFPHRY